MAGRCKAKSRELGATFEINCVADDIVSKEARGESAEFERNLLKSWSRYEGYEDAERAVTGVDRRGKPHRGRVKDKSDVGGVK